MLSDHVVVVLDGKRKQKLSNYPIRLYSLQAFTEGPKRCGFDHQYLEF